MEPAGGACGTRCPLRPIGGPGGDATATRGGPTWGLRPGGCRVPWFAVHGPKDWLA